MTPVTIIVRTNHHYLRVRHHIVTESEIYRIYETVLQTSICYIKSLKA
jgi:hypothetical protein